MDIQATNYIFEFNNKIRIFMKFDPTYNYSQTDLSKEENLILWKFGELIKNLITIASDADKQRNIIGFGFITDEMVSDFDSYFRSSYKQYLDNQLLNKECLEELLLLNEVFERNNGDENPDFWDDALLDSNKDWMNIRLRTKNILKLMDMDNLDIECTHQDIIDKGEVIGLQTKTRLVNKKA